MSDFTAGLEQIRDNPRALLPTRFHNRTDAGNALRFVEQHSGTVRYNPASGRWLVWDGSRWADDRLGEVMRRAKQTARSILTEAANEDDEAERRKLTGHALKSEGKTRLDAMIALAATEAEVVVLPEQLDPDPNLFACRNATLNLKTGEVTDPDPGDLITRRSDVTFDPAATCERFERFLFEIFEGDQERIEYVHRFTGYCLTGHTSEHAFLLAYGPKGRGGKSVLANTIRNVMGEYAAVSDFETFTRTYGDKGPRNDLARLAGVRAVFAAEGQANRKLDEATVKQLTGGDTVAARFLYGETFEYRPQFKLWLTTNRRPRIDGGDEAIWARVREVPFMADFRGREDRTLETTLQRELPGILNWVLAGCLKWQTDGLGTAQAVEESTADYRAGEDVLGAFLTERCHLEGETLKTDLRAAYEAFCDEQGEEPLTGAKLGRELATRGIKAGGAQRRYYQGVSIQ